MDMNPAVDVLRVRRRELVAARESIRSDLAFHEADLKARRESAKKADDDVAALEAALDAIGAAYDEPAQG